MTLELTYVYETAGGFVFYRDTKKEIMDLIRADYKELNEIIKDLQKVYGTSASYCNMSVDDTNPYIAKAEMVLNLNGHYRTYRVRTEFKEII